MEAGNVIAIADIFVSAGVAFWIVNTIQKKLDNRRAIKEHFIGEILSIRSEYRDLILSLKSGESKPLSIKYQLQRLSIHLNGMMGLLSREFQVERNFFHPYLIDLSTKITDDKDYIESYRDNSTIRFSDTFIYDMGNFEDENDKLFNDLVLKINNAK